MLDRETEAKLASGDLSVPVMTSLLVSSVCKPPPGLRRRLAELKSPGAQAAFADTLAPSIAENDPKAAYGTWLVRVDAFVTKCGMKVAREELAPLAGTTGAFLPEIEVERASDGDDCATLTAVHAMNLWPYESRFLGEIAKREFSAAEITRRLWVDAFQKFKASCSTRLSRREAARLDGALGKIDRIVGLDDPLLIELRTKLMAALERNDASSTSSYMLAVSDREKVLDQRNSAAYEAKVKNLESELARTKAATATAARGEQPGAAKVAKGDGIDDVNRGINTARGAVEAVDFARQVFGF